MRWNDKTCYLRIEVQAYFNIDFSEALLERGSYAMKPGGLDKQITAA